MKLIKEIHCGEVILSRILNQDQIFNLCEILGEHEDSIKYHGAHFTGPFSIGDDRILLEIFTKDGEDEVVLIHSNDDAAVVLEYLEYLNSRS